MGVFEKYTYCLKTNCFRYHSGPNNLHLIISHIHRM